MNDDGAVRVDVDERGSSATRTVGLGIAATTVVALPALLVGGLGILIQQDLRFGQAELGASIAASFVAAALVAPRMGRLVEQIGARRTTWLGLGFGAISLLGIGLLARSWPMVALFLAVGGMGITTVQLGVNVLLARAVPSGSRGLAFGAKQAAVPFASLLAGIALPIIGLTLGWQAAFVLAALAIPLVMWRIPDVRPRPERASEAGREDASLGGLILLAVGVALASAGGNSTPAFIVASSTDRGIEPAQAGLVLAIGSLVGIAVRVTGGWVGDRLARGSLLLVVGLICVGAIGYMGLALAVHPALIILFTAFAFGGGWGWAGLILLTLTRTNPNALGRAMGIVQVGPMSGAVVGPLAFGLLADRVSFSAAWFAMSLLAVLAVVIILASRRRLLVRRSPTIQPPTSSPASE